jgi:hypothetical protein
MRDLEPSPIIGPYKYSICLGMHDCNNDQFKIISSKTRGYFTWKKFHKHDERNRGRLP